MSEIGLSRGRHSLDPLRDPNATGNPEKKTRKRGPQGRVYTWESTVGSVGGLYYPTRFAVFEK